MIIILILILITVLLLGIGICVRMKSYWNDWEGWIIGGMCFLIITVILCGVALSHNNFKDMYTEQIQY